MALSTATATNEDPVHLERMRLALSEAQKCTPTPTAFCVGAVLVDPLGTIMSTGYSRELPGNTHAEQCCLEKILPSTPPDGSLLYTTMEPCSTRLSGNKVCVDRIIEAGRGGDGDGGGGIKKVFVGVKEPATFVERNIGEDRLVEAGIEYIHVPGLEAEILQCAMRGHDKREEKATV